MDKRDEKVFGVTMFLCFLLMLVFGYYGVVQEDETLKGIAMGIVLPTIVFGIVASISENIN